MCKLMKAIVMLKIHINAVKPMSKIVSTVGAVLRVAHFSRGQNIYPPSLSDPTETLAAHAILREAYWSR